MASAPGPEVEGARRPVRPLVRRGWVIACLLVAMVIGDRVARRVHRPLCVDACASEGRACLGVLSSGGGFDTSITCRCEGTGSVPRYMVRYMTFKEHFDWLAADLIVFGALLGTVAAVRWLWRPRA
jgi:hypothetical protein